MKLNVFSKYFLAFFMSDLLVYTLSAFLSDGLVLTDYFFLTCWRIILCQLYELLISSASLSFIYGVF